MNVKHTISHSLSVILVSFIGSFIVLFLIILVMLTGVPIHDFNLWRLERSFNSIVMHHPSDSILIENKKYLGGPDTHGSQRCTYAVGEVRSSSKSREEITQTYNSLSVAPILGLKRIPVKVRFTDDSQWSATSPLYNWWGELGSRFKSTPNAIYLVYAIHEGFPFFGDYRCDD